VRPPEDREKDTCAGHNVGFGTRKQPFSSEEKDYVITAIRAGERQVDIAAHLKRSAGGVNKLVVNLRKEGRI
jgi:hypothetical protein